MAKFGVFKGASQAPMQTVEGDYMVQNGEHVTIFRKQSDEADEQVAAFNLDKNFVVKKIE